MKDVSENNSGPSPEEVPDAAAGSQPTTGTSGRPGTSLARSSAEKQPASTQSTAWTAPTRYLAGVGLVVFFVWLIAYSRQTLTLLIFAALIAIIVRPIIDFLHTRVRISQGIAVALTYLVVALLLFAIPLLIVPNIVHAITSLTSIDWAQPIGRFADSLRGFATSVSSIPLVGASLADPINTAAEAVQGLLGQGSSTLAPAVKFADLLASAGRTLGLLGSIVGPLVSGVLSLFFMLLISLQMTIAGGQITGWIMNLVPQRFEDEIGALLDRVMFAWVSFLRGQLSLMVVMGLVVWLMNALLGTPQAMLLGLLAGFLEVIPSLGPVIATIPAALLGLVFGSSMFPSLPPFTFALIIVAGYVLLNLVENQVLVPRILGGAVNLPPLIVLVGVTIAGAQAGIVGVFLATPVIATGEILLRYVGSKINQVPEVVETPEDEPSLGTQVRGLLHGLGKRLRRNG